MRSIVFCSSQRFKKELNDFIDRLRVLAKEKGVYLVIFDPEFNLDRNGSSEDFHLLPEKERMKDGLYKTEVAGKVYDHLFRKVKIADICFIFNKNGYLGANTNGELFAAAMADKLIYALEEKTLMGNFPHDLYEEPSSRKLIHEIVTTPEDLLSRLL